MINMNEPWKHAKQARHKLQLLYDSTYIQYLETSTFTETENRLPGPGRRENGELLSNGYRVYRAFFETIKSLEMDSDGAYNIVNFINANETYT